MATRPIRASQFGAEAPPKNLILPQGNVTLYEQLVFLPNSIRNLDVVLRFAYNGVHQETVSNIIENGRILHKNTGCSVNTALKIMQHGPRYRFSHKTGSGDNWTPAKAFEEDRPDNWDKTNISWNGCRVDAVQKPGCGSLVDGVPFENLAKGVKKTPTGYDALDLTRCVEVAQKNSGVYEFPRDFPTILEQLGGPAAVRYGHLDAAVARRHTRKSVVFKRHLAAGLITEPDNKLVVQAVPDTTTIGNGSFGSSAADKASSNDGRFALRTEQYIELTTLQVLARQSCCQQAFVQRSPVLAMLFSLLRVRFGHPSYPLLLRVRAVPLVFLAQRFPAEALLQVLVRIRIAVSKRLCSCQQALVSRSRGLVAPSRYPRMRCKRYLCRFLLRLRAA